MLQTGFRLLCNPPEAQTLRGVYHPKSPFDDINPTEGFLLHAKICLVVGRA